MGGCSPSTLPRYGDWLQAIPARQAIETICFRRSQLHSGRLFLLIAVNPPLDSYLFRIAHNRSIAMLSRKRLPLEALDDEVDAPDPRPVPEEQFTERQKHSQLISNIRRLPVPYRQVITLALEGLAYAEIAEVPGIEIGNVGARLTRARGLLRTLMEKTI
jgi:DNA-directed RNA polymerase specialized sigma24 family protein